MPYQPKFKIGETVEVTGDGDGADKIGFKVLIFGIWKEMIPYSTVVFPNSDYDSRDSHHTVYGTYCQDRQNYWWYWEKDLSPYCSNIEKGKSFIKQNLLGDILIRYAIIGTQKEDFINNYLKL